MSRPPSDPGPRGATASGGQGGIFYGWVVVAVTFGTQFIVNGCVFYSFAVLLTSLADEFAGGRRTPILLLQLAMGLMGIVTAPLIGRIVGRGWIRPLMAGGAVATGVGLLAAAHASSLWQLGLLFGTLLSVGAGTLAGIPTTTLVVNWFERRRATALGASQLGISLGGMVMAPVVAWLLAERGWRGTYEVLGIVALCAAPVVWLLVVARPEERGLAMDGDRPDAEAPAAGAPGAAPTAPFRSADALREPNLWFISLATGLAFLAGSAVINHIIAYGTDAGFGGSRAALLASVVSGGAALGKLLFGGLCDRIGVRAAFGVSLAGQALGLALLIQVSGYPATLGVVLLIGIALGGTLPLSSALLAATFGREVFGPMMGLMWPIAIPLQLAGPVFAAWIHDASGSYRAAFGSFVGALLLAALLLRLVRLPAVEPGGRRL